MASRNIICLRAAKTCNGKNDNHSSRKYDGKGLRNSCFPSSGSLVWGQRKPKTGEPARRMRRGKVSRHPASTMSFK